LQSEKTFTITHIPNNLVVPEGLHPFTIREYARLPGFPEDFIFENKRSVYCLIGNAVPVQIWDWVGKEALRYFN
jgi:DNA (cytosine-5)-methyltransferase 1